jgi:hypothetical protein
MKRPGVVAAGAALLVLSGIALATPGAFGGYTAKITNSTASAGTANYFTCQEALAPDLSSAYFEWPLTEPSGSTTASDATGNNRTGTFLGSMVADTAAPLGCPRDGGSRWRLDGATNFAYLPTSVTGPQVFSIEVSFQTAAKQGKLIGFGNSSTGTSSSYDRHLYINAAGQLVFGVYSGTTHTISSAAVVTDNAWHHAAATLSASGMKLYLDGALVASNPSSTAAEPGTGYWRVGYDKLSGWPGAPTSGYFNGRLRGAAVYTVELSAQQIANHAAPTFGTGP